MSEPRSYPPNFLDILKEVLDEEEKAKADKSSGENRHYPSSASFISSSGKVVGSCLRQMYYRFTKEPISNPRDLTSQLQMGFGNGIHDWLLSKFQKSKKVRVIPEAAGRVTVDGLTQEVSFRLDGLVTYHGEIGFVEVKTSQSFGLQKMIREGGPKDSHILQCLSYFGTNPDLRWCSLIYFGRDTGYRAEYHLFKDPESDAYLIKGVVPDKYLKKIDDLNFPGIVARWAELEKAVVENKIPAREFKVVFSKDGKITDKRTKNAVDYKSDWQCQYCDYQDVCWSGEDAYDDSVKIPGDARVTKTVHL